jgi:hypothetical protein
MFEVIPQHEERRVECFKCPGHLQLPPMLTWALEHDTNSVCCIEGGGGVPTINNLSKVGRCQSP